MKHSSTLASLVAPKGPVTRLGHPSQLIWNRNATTSRAKSKRLQRCINDLVSLVALPALWSGDEPSQILGTLLDALIGMLGLDLAYAAIDSLVRRVADD
jgi:hypothetical protein